MIKKIRIEQLRPGMFVHDFNCGWFDHPFLGKSTRVYDEHTVRKITSLGIKELYIDTDKGLAVEDAPTDEDVRHEIKKEIVRVADKDTVCRDTVPMREELAVAKAIKKDAVHVVHTVMEDVRLGKNLETEKVDHVVGKMTESIFRNKNALTSLCRIRRADEYTYQHSISVCVLMIAFGRHLGLDPKVIKDIGIGALLHDIGKIKIPSDILNKPYQLSEEEFIIAQEHVVHSRAILEQTRGIHETALLTAAQHHERRDGTGYPHRLKGDEISIYGQMSAIVDVYDATTSCRCYKDEMQPTESLRRLYEWSSSYFNKVLVEYFIQCIGIYPIGSLVRLASGWIGVVIQNGEKNLLQPVVRAIYNARTESYPKLPHDIDLSLPSNGRNDDRIIDYENPKKWGIRPEMYF